MKISTNWLKDYVELPEDLNVLANQITNSGVNVENVETKKINNLVIGYVKECTKHPDSDHLNVCLVDIGTDIQIVCGASNVKKGIKVIVALVGAILPGNFEIKKTTIRGVESNGMICALYELGLESKETGYSKGIHVIEENLTIGSDANSYLGLDDTIYELDLNPNRNDCLSHIGFAYEAAASLKTKVTMPDISYNEIEEDITNHLALDVITDNVPVYLNKMVTDVVIKPSPEFIQKRLLAVGLKPINNVVDISNYIMLEYGQPLHFFDYDKLNGKIIVRDDIENELVTTLDEKEHILNQGDIVITSKNKIIAIAGVMGGENSSINNETKKIVIESAIFNPINIRKTAIKCNSRTDASLRLDKPINYDYTYNAIDRACQLLEKYADGKVLKGILKHDRYLLSERKVTVNQQEINSLLGLEISIEDIKSSLTNLGFEFNNEKDKFIIEVPRRRMDVELNKADIIEEIGRMYGYDNIVSTPSIAEIKKGNYIGNVAYRKLISKRLRSQGLNETRTYSLQSEKDSELFEYQFGEKISLLKPMSTDKAILRRSLISSLLKVIDYNNSHNVKDILIYEISNIYQNKDEEIMKLAVACKGDYINSNWKKNKIKVDFYLLKGFIENILDYLGLKNRYSFIKKDVFDIHPGVSAVVTLDREEIGFIGKVHPSKRSDDVFVFELNLTKVISKKVKPIKYKEPNKFPSIEKDIAFIVDKNQDSNQIYEIIKKTGGRILSKIEIFDIYQGSNLDSSKKSIAFNLVFEDENKTLTDEEVTIVFNKIINNVIKTGAILRDK